MFYTHTILVRDICVFYKIDVLVSHLDFFHLCLEVFLRLWQSLTPLPTHLQYAFICLENISKLLIMFHSLLSFFKTCSRDWYWICDSPYASVSWVLRFQVWVITPSMLFLSLWILYSACINSRLVHVPSVFSQLPAWDAGQSFPSTSILQTSEVFLFHNAFLHLHSQSYLFEFTKDLYNSIFSSS